MGGDSTPLPPWVPPKKYAVGNRVNELWQILVGMLNPVSFIFVTNVCKLEKLFMDNNKTNFLKLNRTGSGSLRPHFGLISGH